MSRLDHHVAAVQTKLALRRFGSLFARTTFIFGLLVLLAVVVDKVSQTVPANLRDRYRIIILIGVGVCALISAIWAGLTRPSREQAATAIDEKLRLKEKFSTAIYVRPSSDPFAMAAVKDAERTAENVQLGKQFPVPYPRMAWATKLVFALALGFAYFMPSISLFGQRSNVAKKPEAEAVQLAAKENIARAIAAVDAMPKSSQNSDEFRKLVAELHEFNKAPKLDDPNRANRRALQALQEVTTRPPRNGTRPRNTPKPRTP